MLEAMRDKAGSWVVRILAVFIAISFAIWGIGDIFRGSTKIENVADVGGLPISAAELNQQFRRDLNRLRSVFGPEFDVEQARRLGVMERSLEQLIEGRLLSLEARALDVLVSDDLIARRIREDTSFRNQLGQFDRAVFRQVLAQNDLAEDTYIAALREQTARSNVVGGLASGSVTPNALADAVFRYRHERRIADVVRIAREQIPEAADPDDATIFAYHASNADIFSSPERRAATFLFLDPKEYANEIRPAEERIKEEYEHRLPQLTRVERRKLSQLIARDEDVAKAARAALADGKPIVDVATETTRQPPDTIELGRVAKTDLTGELSRVAFDLPEGGISAPVRSPLGWHVLRVDGIEPGGQPSLAELRDRIARDLALDMAADALVKLSQKIEDALAGGSKLEDAADLAGAKIQKLPAIDTEGNDSAGNVPANLPRDRKFMQTLFTTLQGQTSALFEFGDSVFAVLRIDEVVVQALRPLTEVQGNVIAAWKRERRDEAAKKKADDLQAAIAAGKPFDAAAVEAGLTVAANLSFMRLSQATEATVPPALAAQLFAKPLNAVEVARTENGFAVGQVKEIIAADPAQNQTGLDEVRTQLKQVIAGDIVAQFTAALRARYPVTTNDRALGQLLDQGERPLPRTAAR